MGSKYCKYDLKKYNKYAKKIEIKKDVKRTIKKQKTDVNKLSMKHV